MSAVTQQLGEYRLTRRLGVGGMAEVWEAEHTRTGELAAVKVMLAAANLNPKLRESFVAEARSHARLDHPQIVQLLDYGVASEADQLWDEVVPGDPYLAMELADGTLRDSMPTNWTQLHRALSDVLEGLAYSHARGVVHRDLKPENVLVTADGYKLADFGIAHSVNLDETADRAALKTTIGTPQYMAPEQFRGEWYDFGPSTDLYALGCLAYELAARRVPFSHTKLFALAVAHLGEEVPPLTPVIDVPEGFEAWLKVLLEKRPERRYQFAADARAALDALSTGFTSSESYAGAMSARVEIEHDAATLVDAFATLALGLTMDASEGLDTTETEPFSVPRFVPNLPTRAPFPRNWRRGSRSARKFARLGLFGMREVPLVGFEVERDALWSILADVVERGACRVVILRGTSKSPVSALGAWLARRAAESGAAVTWETFYTRTGGPREGLVALLEDIVGTWGMEDDEVPARIRKYLAARVPSEVAEPVAGVVEAIIGNARGADIGGFVPSRGERNRAVTEVLSGSAADRPFAVWFDDIQWGPAVLDLVTHFSATGRPGLIVLGISDSMEPEHESTLADLPAHSDVRWIDVREPTHNESKLQARALIQLEPDLEDDAVRLTGADVVGFRLLVEDLRLSDLLEAGDRGYHLVEHAALPLAPEQVFHRALDRFARTHPTLVRPLEVAGALGRAPDPQELERVCGALQINPAGLREALVDQGLAGAIGNRWWFQHDALVGTVNQRLRATGRWPATHRACAMVLLDRRFPGADELVRAARHLRAAGAERDALGPTFRAMRALLAEDVRRVDALLASYGDVCTTLGLPDDSPEILASNYIRMVRLLMDGKSDESLSLARTTVDHAVAAEQSFALGMALRHQARLAARIGELAQAAQLLRRAEDVAVRTGQRAEQAAAARVLGQIYDQLGEFGDAGAALDRAITLYGEDGDLAGRARAMVLLASVRIRVGDHAGARTLCESAMQISQRAGGAGAVEAAAMLGELARAAGEFARAREWYMEARARYALGAEVNAWIMDLNIAIMDLAEKKWTDAASTFLDLEVRFQEANVASLIAVALAGQAVCAAAKRDEGATTQAFDKIRAMLGTSGSTDVVDVLELGREVLELGPTSVLGDGLERERSLLSR